MRTPGKDSPDKLVVLPAIHVKHDGQGNEVPQSLGFLIYERQTVNDNVRTTVGSTAAYREGWKRAFGKGDSEQN